MPILRRHCKSVREQLDRSGFLFIKKIRQILEVKYSCQILHLGKLHQICTVSCPQHPIFKSKEMYLLRISPQNMLMQS